MLKLFDLLRAAGDDLDPKECKLYLSMPWTLENFLAGRFARDNLRWQKSAGIFSRKRIIALIEFPRDDGYGFIFAGCWDQRGHAWIDAEKEFRFDIKRRNQTRDLAGRAVVSFEYADRQRSLRAEEWEDKLVVDEISRAPKVVEPFPGFMKISLSYSRLRALFEQPTQSWETALSVVRGIYVVTDESVGKLYIGKADGENGIWGRWMAYAESGHGGNVELRKLLREKGKDYARHFRFSILETADARADSKHLDARESHWKNVFQTRAHGYNEN